MNLEPVWDVQILNLCLLFWVHCRTPLYIFKGGSKPLNLTLDLLGSCVVFTNCTSGEQVVRLILFGHVTCRLTWGKSHDFFSFPTHFDEINLAEP